MAEPAASPSVKPEATGAAPSASPAPVERAVFTPGALAVTVTDDLRVRSEPRVAESSVRHAPLLPQGTSLVVLGGPVEGSGYTWIEVAPIGFALRDGVDAGWVAIADRDGTPWVAPATDDTPGYELASVTVDRPADRLADAKAAAAAQNAFGIALYKRMLRDRALQLSGRSVVLSPYSIVTALAMARAGAKGDTATQMDRVLRVDGWNRLGTGLNALDQRLTSRDAAWVDGAKTSHWLRLRTANMSFGQADYHIDGAYLERLAKTFGAGLGLVDYIGDAAAAREAINGWVSRQTVGRIPKLLGPEDVTGDTRLVLVNAVYLKAEWEYPFDPDQTRQRAFTTLSGKEVRVPTMTRTGEQDMVIASGDGWRATELRYRGGDDTSPLAMTLILPDTLQAFERSLSPDLLAQVQRRLRAEEKRQQKVAYTGVGDMDCGTYAYNVRLLLPKFGTDTRANLNDTLKASGMPLAFDVDLADFTGITAEDRLHIAAVIHQANIDVDEEGTEAAAATAVGMDTGGCTGPSPRTTKTLRLDRPFLYVIRDVETGAILFMGRVVNPAVRS
jgi:serpin B